jgi:hypothetical protein
MLLVTLAGWVNEEQPVVIDRVPLCEPHSEKRLRFTDVSADEACGEGQAARAAGAERIRTDRDARYDPVLAWGADRSEIWFLTCLRTRVDVSRIGRRTDIGRGFR